MRSELKKRITRAEQKTTPEDREFRFITIDANGDETGEGMIVRPNQPTEFYTYTPKTREVKE